jgi:hypothetical protein
VELHKRGKPLEHRLITGLDQGRWACQPRSVPGYSCLTAKSEFKCPGVGRSRDTPVRDRDVQFRRMDISQNNGAGAPPAEEQVQRAQGAAVGGNPVAGNPSAGNMAPQAQTHTAQNTAQGGAATPLETGLRQRGNVENQRAAEAKAAREAALASFNRERRQKSLRNAQELIECLGSGMDLLTPEQVAQITEAAAAAGSEPREALRSFGERLRDLRNKNPHASEADLREAVKGAVQAMIAKSRGQRRRADTQRVAAESDMPRDVTRLPETRRTTRHDIPGPPSGRMLRGAESEVEQMHNYISHIGCNLHEAIRNRDADLIKSYRRALHSGIARAQETTNRPDAQAGTPRRSTACCRRWRSPRPHCCPWLSSWRKRPGPTGKREQSTMPRRSPTWPARHSRP